MAAALTPLVPIIAPHLRNGAMDIALVKHQGMAIAAGLAVGIDVNLFFSSSSFFLLFGLGFEVVCFVCVCFVMFCFVI